MRHQESNIVHALFGNTELPPYHGSDFRTVNIKKIWIIAPACSYYNKKEDIAAEIKRHFPDLYQSFLK